MSRKTQRNAGGARRRPLLIVLVSLFLLADVFLVGWALKGARAPATSAVAETTAPYTGASIEPQVSASPTPSSSALPDAGDTITTAVSPLRVLAAFDGTTAWRTATGACPATPALPQVTTDSGATWKTTDATTSTKIAAVQNLVATSKTALEVVGLSIADCGPAFAKTFVSGDNYAAYPEQLGAKWYVDPATPSQVHAPTGQVAAPCAAVVSLAANSTTSAVALCADNQIFLTTNQAKTWSAAATVAGAVNVALSRTGYLVAAVGNPECAGVQIFASAGGATPNATGCFATDIATENLIGNVGIASAAGTLWLWVGDSIGRSTDAGATWK
jgi:hypothetical protein